MSMSQCGPKEYVKYLDQVSVLDSLLAEEKKQVANALVEILGVWNFFGRIESHCSGANLRMHFEKKDVIIQQGEPGNMSEPKTLQMPGVSERFARIGSTSCMRARWLGSRQPAKQEGNLREI